MQGARTQAELYLNDTPVGTVEAEGGSHDSWSFGRFHPAPAFAAFAPLFGRWSLLMHAGGGEALSKAARDELRRAECAIDGLHAKLRVGGKDEWIEVAQLNIDGTLIEWKVVGKG